MLKQKIVYLPTKQGSRESTGHCGCVVSGGLITFVGNMGCQPTVKCRRNGIWYTYSYGPCNNVYIGCLKMVHLILPLENGEVTTCSVGWKRFPTWDNPVRSQKGPLATFPLTPWTPHNLWGPPPGSSGTAMSNVAFLWCSMINFYMSPILCKCCSHKTSLHLFSSRIESILLALECCCQNRKQHPGHHLG